MATKLVSLDKSRMIYPDKDRMVAEFMNHKKEIEDIVKKWCDELRREYRIEKGLSPVTDGFNYFIQSSREVFGRESGKLMARYGRIERNHWLVTLPVPYDYNLFAIVCTLLFVKTIFFPYVVKRNIYVGITDMLSNRIDGHITKNRIGSISPMVGVRCNSAVLAADAEYILDRVFGFRDTDHPEDDPLDWGHGGDTDSKVVYLFNRNILNVMPKRK